jgi:hypothetical protein
MVVDLARRRRAFMVCFVFVVEGWFGLVCGDQFLEALETCPPPEIIKKIFKLMDVLMDVMMDVLMDVPC